MSGATARRVIVNADDFGLSPAVSRGIEYLIKAQREDGSWEEAHWTGTGFPGVFYLRYHLYPLYFPLLTLGEYARRKALLEEEGGKVERPWDDTGAVAS